VRITNDKELKAEPGKDEERARRVAKAEEAMILITRHADRAEFLISSLLSWLYFPSLPLLLALGPLVFYVGVGKEPGAELLAQGPSFFSGREDLVYCERLSRRYWW